MTIKPRAVAWPTSTPMRPINDAGEDTVCGVSSREAATKVPLAAGLEYWSVTLNPFFRLPFRDDLLSGRFLVPLS